MKIKILYPLLFLCSFCLAQNVKIEITDLSKKEEGKQYAIYQFANASYSSSRPAVFFITPKDQFLNSINKIPVLFKRKQEYTDVWILGLDLNDKTKLSETEKKIINIFFEKIIKYRSDNGLPSYDLSRLSDRVIFLEKSRDVCKYLICSTK